MAPTIYEILGITPPRVVNGVPQDPIDGVSFAYTFNDAKAKDRKHTQYFEVMGSRSIYHDGWIASAFGPRVPWKAGLPPGIREWTPDKDKWELYNLDDDWSQANDLADKMPQKLADMKDLFLIEFAKNQGFPIGGGLWIPMFHPELRKTTPYTEWDFPGEITRMPEFCAPALGNKPNVVTIDADIPEKANGVLYALGGFSGGLSLLRAGRHALLRVQPVRASTHAHPRQGEAPPGKAKIEVETSYVEPKPAGPLKVVIKVNGKEAASGVVPVSAPLLFTANDCLDIGTDLGSPVSVDYYDKAPFKFNGKIEKHACEVCEVAHLLWHGQETVPQQGGGRATTSRRTLRHGRCRLRSGDGGGTVSVLIACPTRRLLMQYRMRLLALAAVGLGAGARRRGGVGAAEHRLPPLGGAERAAGRCLAGRRVGAAAARSALPGAHRANDQGLHQGFPAGSEGARRARRTCWSS